MLDNSKIVALIPARASSKRIPNKNISPLAGHPLIAYTIVVAVNSGIFSDVIVSTDSEFYAEIAQYYGAEVPFLRSSEFAKDFSPDIEWVEDMLKQLKHQGRVYDCFSILRPTSPFRQVDTIRKAWRIFNTEQGVDSLRAVEKCRQHPGKMWIIRGNRMLPLLPFRLSNTPWHSCQYQSLPEVYVQNASLEIARTRVVFNNRTISGEVIVPFYTEGYEGFDINYPEDWVFAEKLIKDKKIDLQLISKKPFIIKDNIKI